MGRPDTIPTRSAFGRRLWALRCCGYLFFALWVNVSAAQSALPPRPADGIWDDTRALTETDRTALAARIATFRQETGNDVWITAVTFLETNLSIRQHARELRQSWSGDHSAILIAYDRASEKQSVSVSPAMWLRYPSERLIHVIQEVNKIMLDTRAPLDQRFMAAGKEMIQRLEILEKQRQVSDKNLQPADIRFFTKFAPALGAGTLLLFLLGTLSRRQDLSRSIRFHLPETEVGIRFGAPFGGGVVVEPGNASRD